MGFTSEGRDGCTDAQMAGWMVYSSGIKKTKVNRNEAVTAESGTVQ